MGYTTQFEGQFELNKTLDDKTANFIRELNRTRRMMRDTSKLPKTGFEKHGFTSWGLEGEFYVDSKDQCGQDRGPSVAEYSAPPGTQPSLWFQWVPTEDNTAIKWDENEKFYDYDTWLDYLISKVLSPRGYVLNGKVKFQGEAPEDFGIIVVKDNFVNMAYGVHDIQINKNSLTLNETILTKALKMSCTELEKQGYGDADELLVGYTTKATKAVKKS